ncbi:MAG TPA: PAS domain S-box protein [Syntrophales bacterium]|nr:PAS domain S-box protein [Syntrophales bacterium]
MKHIPDPFKIVLVGGGKASLDFLRIARFPAGGAKDLEVLGIFDPDPRSPGLRYARSAGIAVFPSHLDLLRIGGFEAVLVLSEESGILAKARRRKPAGVRVMDSREAAVFLDRLRVRRETRVFENALRDAMGKPASGPDDPGMDVAAALDRYSSNLLKIIEEKNRQVHGVEKRRLHHDRVVSQIVRGSTIPMFVINQKHEVTHWNKALERVTGRLAEEMVGTRDQWKAFYPVKKPCLADLVVDGKDEQEIRKFFRDRAKPSEYLKGSYEAENFYPRMGPSGRWLYFTAAPIRGMDGRILGAIETLWDTTAQREARERLKEIEAIEASILDTIHIAALVLRERRIIFANEAAESVFGWRAGDLVGRNTRILYPGDAVYEGVGKDFYRALETRRTFRGEYPCVRKDGREILCVVRASRIGERLREQAIVATYEDITERKKAEQELVSREKTLSQIIEGSTIPTFVIDREHTVTHWNRAIERLTGKTAREMVGTRDHWKAFYDDRKPIMADVIVDHMPEDEIAKLYGRRWRRSALIDEAYEAEDFFPRMAEKGKWLFFTGAPLKGPDGAVTGAIETLWDTTDSKLLQQERERHLRQISTLGAITSAMSESLDLGERFRAAASGILANLDVDSVILYMREAGGDCRVAYSKGLAEGFYPAGSGVGVDSVVEKVSRRGRAVFFENVDEESAPFEAFVDKEHLRSAAYLPLTSKHDVIGVIRVSSRRKKFFSEEDKNLLALVCNRVALAIENARLHQEAKMFGQRLEIKVREKTAELEQSYREIRQSEERYRTMFDADPNPILISDRKTMSILDVNATALDCYGFTKEEFLGLTFPDLLFDRDRDLMEDLRKMTPHQSLFHSKKLVRKKTGLPFYANIHIRAAEFMGRDCFIAATPDVTETVNQEARLIQAGKLATLGTMASGIAHEINQPLNVIQVCSDFLMKKLAGGDERCDDEVRTMAEEIGKNVQRAAMTIKHMKDFSRQSEVTRDRVSINRPLLDVFKILGQQLRVHDIEVVLDLQEDLPEILGDHNRLEQVFINFVNNAMDAMDEKKLRFDSGGENKVLTIRSFREGDSVVVTIGDTGIGIPEQNLDKIFEPFFTTKEVGRGTGLGMSISYGIVKDYGGTIEVRSTVNQGTTFRIAFPVLKEETNPS